MRNIKGYAIATDGGMKRIAITYDEINEEGKVINPNVKINRIVTDASVIGSIGEVDAYAQSIVDEE